MFLIRQEFNLMIIFESYNLPENVFFFCTDYLSMFYFYRETHNVPIIIPPPAQVSEISCAI